MRAQAARPQEMRACFEKTTTSMALGKSRRGQSTQHAAERCFRFARSPATFRMFECFSARIWLIEGGAMDDFWKGVRSERSAGRSQAYIGVYDWSRSLLSYFARSRSFSGS
jgi:hypothetical protein